MTDELVTVPRLLLEDLQRRVAELEGTVRKLTGEETPPEEKTDGLGGACSRFNEAARKREEKLPPLKRRPS